ncbi:TPA: hypothetical protein IAA87_05760 [Candidatus Avigastranaerophilus faecigallinarum]|nr:hypothetical protein [Candidatus Avigastranaerophilus faecigallinarum]
MSNNLQDLNKYLFEQIEKLSNEDLDEKQTELAIKKAEAITGVSEKIIKNAELALKIAIVKNKMGNFSLSGEIPALTKKIEQKALPNNEKIQ